VRFAPHPGMGFPSSEIKTVEYDEEDDSKPPLIRTTFMGMYGVDSPLPTAYLDDITQRREGLGIVDSVSQDDTGDLADETVAEALIRLPGVNDTRTYVVMEEVKQSNRLVIKTR